MLMISASLPVSLWKSITATRAAATASGSSSVLTGTIAQYPLSRSVEQKSNKKSFSNKEFIGSICPVCGKKFKKVTGKIYCSAECREKSKNYPSKVEVEFQYSILHSWKKVAEYFNITAKTLQGIRKK